MNPETPIATPPLSSEEASAFAQLSPGEVAEIDEAILLCVHSRWQKLAMVVGLALEKLRGQYPQFSEVFYSERVSALAKQGRLESRGNLCYMRFSEVRLPDKS